MLSDGFRRIYADNEGRSRRPKLLKPGKTVSNVATHWLFIPDAPGVPRVRLLRRQAHKYRLACRLRLLQPASTLRLQRRIFVLAASAGLVIAGNSDLTGRSLRGGKIRSRTDTERSKKPVRARSIAFRVKTVSRRDFSMSVVASRDPETEGTKLPTPHPVIEPVSDTRARNENFRCRDGSVKTAVPPLRD